MSKLSNKQDDKGDEKDSPEVLEKYQQLLERALKTNFIYVHPFNPIYAAGLDWHGRRIVIINAHCINVAASKEELLSYFVLKMNRVVCTTFCFQ